MPIRTWLQPCEVILHYYCYENFWYSSYTHNGEFNIYSPQWTRFAHPVAANSSLGVPSVLAGLAGGECTPKNATIIPGVSNNSLSDAFSPSTELRSQQLCPLRPYSYEQRVAPAPSEVLRWWFAVTTVLGCVEGHAWPGTSSPASKTI